MHVLRTPRVFIYSLWYLQTKNNPKIILIVFSTLSHFDTSTVGISIQGNSGPMVLYKCLTIVTCIRSKSNHMVCDNVLICKCLCRMDGYRSMTSC